MLKLYIAYAKAYEMAKKAPARLIFYRGMFWPFLFFAEIYSHSYLLRWCFGRSISTCAQYWYVVLSLSLCINSQGFFPARITHDQKYVQDFLVLLALRSICILDACKATGINPKITLIIVGKRHHIRYIPGLFMEALSSDIPYLVCSLRTDVMQT